jgi:hypothetical protein
MIKHDKKGPPVAKQFMNTDRYQTEDENKSIRKQANIWLAMNALATISASIENDLIILHLLSSKLRNSISFPFQATERI